MIFLLSFAMYCFTNTFPKMLSIKKNIKRYKKENRLLSEVKKNKNSKYQSKLVKIKKFAKRLLLNWKNF